MIIFKADPGIKEVALIFDDGPNPQVTPKLLSVLKEKHAIANFFLIGARVEEYPEIARRIAQEGHEIGNHTYTHKRLVQMLKHSGEKSVLEEIAKGDSAIRNITGIATPMFLRPPYLEWNEELSKIASPIYQDRIIMAELVVGDWDWGQDHYWDKDDKNAIGEQAEKIIKSWKDITKSGTLLAFHDSSEHNLEGNKTYETWMNRALPTLEAIPQIIDYLHKEGFAIKKLSDMKLIVDNKAKR